MNRRSQFIDKNDKKKSDWEIEQEIEELKKKKNKDVESIKILKIEVGKLEGLYKKYKETVLQNNAG